MTSHAWSLLGLYLAVLLLLVKPMGIYLAKVMDGGFRFGARLECPLYRLCGIVADEEMSWLRYAFAILLFNALGVLAVYALQRMQAWLPLNPHSMAKVGDTRQGWAVLAAMTILFICLAIPAMHFEQQANPLLTQLGVDPVAGNMEGKEARFGIAESGLFATITTSASCGAVIATHDSFMPMGGLIPLVGMHLGEVVFGGVGTGLYGMLVFAILAVFISGLMIGRTRNTRARRSSHMR